MFYLQCEQGSVPREDGNVGGGVAPDRFCCFVSILKHRRKPINRSMCYPKKKKRYLTVE